MSGTSTPNLEQGPAGLSLAKREVFERKLKARRGNEQPLGEFVERIRSLGESCEIVNSESSNVASLARPDQCGAGRGSLSNSRRAGEPSQRDRE